MSNQGKIPQIPSIVPLAPEFKFQIPCPLLVNQINPNLKSENILNFNLTHFKGDSSNVKNSFLTTRAIIGFNSQEIESFFTKKISENKQKIENNHPEQVSNSLQMFIEFQKCSSLISALRKLNHENKFKNFLQLFPKIFQEDFHIEEKLLEFIFSYDNIVMINSIIPKNAEIESINKFLEKNQDFKVKESNLSEEWLMLNGKFPSIKIFFDALGKIIELENEIDDLKSFLDDLICCYYSIVSNENLRIFSKTILEIHNFLRLKKGENKLNFFNFIDIAMIINKKIEGKNLFDIIFDVYKSNLHTSNLKEIQIFNTKTFNIIEKISKVEILGFDFSGFERMKKFYDNNLQTLLIYLNKNTMLLNFINKNFLRQIEFKLNNHIVSDIECYKRSLEELGKYLLLKVKPEANFYNDVKKSIFSLYELASKVKNKVSDLLEKQIKQKKFNEVNKKLNGTFADFSVNNESLSNEYNENPSINQIIHEKVDMSQKFQYEENMFEKQNNDDNRINSKKPTESRDNFSKLNLNECQNSSKRASINELNSISETPEESERKNITIKNILNLPNDDSNLKINTNMQKYSDKRKNFIEKENINILNNKTDKNEKEINFKNTEINLKIKKQNEDENKSNVINKKNVKFDNFNQSIKSKYKI